MVFKDKWWSREVLMVYSPHNLLQGSLVSYAPFWETYIEQLLSRTCENLPALAVETTSQGQTGSTLCQLPFFYSAKAKCFLAVLVCDWTGEGTMHTLIAPVLHFVSNPWAAAVVCYQLLCACHILDIVATHNGDVQTLKEVSMVNPIAVGSRHVKEPWTDYIGYAVLLFGMWDFEQYYCSASCYEQLVVASVHRSSTVYSAMSSVIWVMGETTAKLILLYKDRVWVDTSFPSLVGIFV